MPPEEIIIADSSPLIGLARIAMLPLLPKLARRIVVPPAVRSEITEAKHEAPGAKDVGDQFWIKTLAPDPAIVAPLRILVGLGEAEAIALAQREPASVLLLDDLRARIARANLCPRLCQTELSRVVTRARLRLSSAESVLRKCLEMGANTSNSDPRLQE